MQGGDQMTGHTIPIEERLSAAESPGRLLNWYEKPGYYVSTCRVSKDDIPGLIKIVRKWSDPYWLDDDEFGEDDSDINEDSSDSELLPVTAWRALADLEASESVDALIEMLRELDDADDDWALDELPHVFGKIGEPAVEALLRVAKDTTWAESIRSVAAEALHHVAKYHAETRDEVVARMTEMMKEVNDCDLRFNSILLSGLVNLHAVEAAEAIERAFANDRLDVGMLGDWETVRQELGVEGLGLEMPKNPHNTIEQYRRRVGIGIFSDRRIFDDGGVKSAAAQAYYQRAWDVFSESEEAEQVISRCGNIGFFHNLIEFGIEYLGEIVDEMTPGSVDEFLLNYVPRKVSTTPDRADELVFELTMFWEFLDRVYGLPGAKLIIDWLKTDGLSAQLETELADPTNYGMAKSFVMAGIEAGYDMTSQEGTAQFMAAYNQSLLAGRAAKPAAKASVPEKVVSKQQRVGRNDPCPCGSGKKFKKCCR